MTLPISHDLILLKKMLLVQYLSTRNILQNFLNFFYPCIHQNTKNCYFFHNSSDFNKNYSWRSASIGFRFAALYEGSIPNMIPIAIEKSTASIAAAGLIAVGVPFSIEMTLERITPTSTPKACEHNSLCEELTEDCSLSCSDCFFKSYL